MTGDLLPHRSLREFQAYLEGRRYMASTIQRAMQNAKVLMAKFPAGLPRDVDVALSEMGRTLAGGRANASSVRSHRTQIRRYHEFLLSCAEVAP